MSIYKVAQEDIIYYFFSIFLYQRKKIGYEFVMDSISVLELYLWRQGERPEVVFFFSYGVFNSFFECLHEPNSKKKKISL